MKATISTARGELAKQLNPCRSNLFDKDRFDSVMKALEMGEYRIARDKAGAWLNTAKRQLSVQGGDRDVFQKACKDMFSVEVLVADCLFVLCQNREDYEELFMLKFDKIKR